MKAHCMVGGSKRLRSALALLVMLSLVGAACGSDESGPNSNQAAGEQPEAATGAETPETPVGEPGDELETPSDLAATPDAPGQATAPTDTSAAGSSAPKQAPKQATKPTAGSGAPSESRDAPRRGAAKAPAPAPAPAPGQPAAPGTPTAPAPSPAAPPTGGTIKIGGINPLSGSLSLIGKPAEQAARAYFRSINDAGGVLGKKIEYIVEDDANDANRTRAAAEKLIERDEIFVMGPSFTPYSPDIVRFLESKGVPFIGWDGLVDENDLPLASPTTVTVAGATKDLAAALFPYWVKQENLKRIGMFYTEYGPAVTLRNETKKQAKRLGVDIVKETPVNQQTNAFVPLLLDMQRSNVDGIIYWNAADIFLKAIVQQREMKYKPRGGWLASHGATNDLVPKSCGTFCDGLRVPWNVWPHVAPNGAIDEMKKTISKYYGEINHDLYTEIPYISSKVVVDFIRQAGVVDRAKILEVARAATAYDTGGFTNGPIDISPGKPHLGRETIVMRVQKGVWEKETDWIKPEPSA